MYIHTIYVLYTYKDRGFTVRKDALFQVCMHARLSISKYSIFILRAWFIVIKPNRNPYCKFYFLFMESGYYKKSNL